MTFDELRTDYIKAIRIVRAEKEMRRKVFRNDPGQQALKVAEMNVLEDILTRMKEALKPHCEPVYEQPALLEVKQERRAEFS